MRYRFSDFEIDDDPIELRRDGQPIDLQPKVLLVLHFLVRNAHRMVTKEELFEHAWPGVAVTEASLTRCISIIRRELGDETVETLRGRGYRMGVDVRTVGEAPLEAPRRTRRTWPLAAGALVLLLGGFAWLGRPFARLDIPTTVEVTRRPATDVAVLPLEVVGIPDDPDDLGRRIALEVIDRLATAHRGRIEAWPPCGADDLTERLLSAAKRGSIEP